MIVFDDNKNDSIVLRYGFSVNVTGVKNIDHIFTIDKTDFYYIVLLKYICIIDSCDENVDQLTFNMKISMMNPFGYLPGESYGRLPFEGCIII